MLIYSLLSLLFFSVALAAPTLSSKEFLALAGIPQHKIEQLDQGEIITHKMRETSDKEFAMSTAIYLLAPLNKVVDYMRNIEMFAIDSDVTAYGLLPLNANTNDFKGFVFSANQLDEAIDLLNSDKGDRFNLSSQEIASFSALHNALSNPDNDTLLKSVSQKYRDILLQRWQAYRVSGLKGVADYSRDEGVASPAAELYSAVENCKALSHFFSEFLLSWTNYPVLLPSGVEQRFYWINRMVENRPTAILSHSMLQINNSGVLIVGRQFYAGHSFNSSNMCVGILPYREGTLLYYVESSSTDQVAGVASGLRHTVAREQLKEQMIKHLEKLAKNFQTATSFQSP